MSKDIICPNCEKAFKIDGSSYDEILKQVRDKSFNQQIADIRSQLDQDKVKDITLLETKYEAELVQLKQEQSANNVLTQASHLAAIEKLQLENNVAVEALKQEIAAINQQKTQSVKDAVNVVEGEKQSLQVEIDKLHAKLVSVTEITKAQHATELERIQAEKTAEIKALQSDLLNSQKAQEQAVKDAIATAQAKNSDLENKIVLLKNKLNTDLSLATSLHQAELEKLLAEKASEYQKMKSEFDAEKLKQKQAIKEAETKTQAIEKDLRRLIEKNNEEAIHQQSLLEANHQIALKTITTEKEAEIQKLVNQQSVVTHQHQLALKTQEERFAFQLKDRDVEIERLRDMKAKLSTKMLGETLESHCQNAFDQVRHGAFPHAQFGKDNDASTGSKGDYIFRDIQPNSGIETLSIMFEMKNESDNTKNKKKNKDFFKELDKDRREKNCEYAVLVSLLEPESELYNGITDVSHYYPKMYVVRPQFFIPLITLLRNAALKSLEYKHEIDQIKNANIDITNFENDIEQFKNLFGKHYKNASNRFADAIKTIDNSIAQLTKTRDHLLNSENHLRLANNKAEDLSIKKLTQKIQL